MTVRNLKVVRVDAENNLLLRRGRGAGGPNGYVVIRKAVAAKPLKVAQVEPGRRRARSRLGQAV